MRRNFTRGMLCLFIISACSGGSGGGGAPNGNNTDNNAAAPQGNSTLPSGHWVTGYYPSYQQTVMPPSEIDFASMTHLIHWPVLPKPDGSLDTVSVDFTPAHSADVVSRAHAAGVKVLLGVGGDKDSGATAGFQGATKPENRATFINNIVSLMQTRGYDGVDINWEVITPADDPSVIALFQELRQALDKISPRPLLTMPPTTGGDSRPDLVAKFQGQLDQINIQTYVMSGAYDDWVTWFNSPLENGDATFPCCADQRLPSVSDEVKRFTKAGIPASKIGIGIQFGAFVWAGGTGTDTGGATKPRQAWKTPPTVTLASYTDVVKNFLGAPGFSKSFDPVARVPYLSRDSANNADDRFISYDDEQAIQEKVTYVRNQGLGGLFVFELSGDYLPAQPAGQRHPLIEVVK